VVVFVDIQIKYLNALRYVPIRTNQNKRMDLVEKILQFCIKFAGFNASVNILNGFFKNVMLSMYSLIPFLSNVASIVLNVLLIEDRYF
jgi:hypothetical protein